MKRPLYFLLLSVFIFGCAKGAGEKTRQVVARINNYEISKEEFSQKLSELAPVSEEREEAKKELLEMLINKALIIQDAQNKGLDKKQDFLQMIERFWEHSLVKLALDEELRQIEESVQVSEELLQDKYQALVTEGSADKTYEEMRAQLKWEIQKDLEAKLINQWLEGLRQKADIEIGDVP